MTLWQFHTLIATLFFCSMVNRHSEARPILLFMGILNYASAAYFLWFK